MPLTEPERERVRVLRNDRRRLSAQASRYQRLADQYRAMQAETELALCAVITEIRALEWMNE